MITKEYLVILSQQSTKKVARTTHNSRFTHDFEDHFAYCSPHLNKKETSRLMRVAWNTVGEVLTRVRKDLERNLEDRFNGLEIIGIDETVSKRDINI